MNFFFGFKNKELSSALTIPKFTFYGKKFIIKKGYTKLISIDNCELISIISNSYLLRLIIFEKKLKFVDVDHG